MKTSETSKITIQLVDSMRRRSVYDGILDDWNAPVKLPLDLSYWDFTFAEIDRQNFSQLKTILGMNHFRTIVETQGYAYPGDEFENYQGEDRLPLRYDLKAHQATNVYELILVSFGEFQPSRWIAHIEGIWHVTGIKL